MYCHMSIKPDAVFTASASQLTSGYWHCLMSHAHMEREDEDDIKRQCGGEATFIELSVPKMLL